MSEERKADMEAAVAELEHAVWLAIKQGVMPEDFRWALKLTAPDGETWVALLSVGHVAEAP